MEYTLIIWKKMSACPGRSWWARRSSPDSICAIPLHIAGSFSDRPSRSWIMQCMSLMLGDGCDRRVIEAKGTDHLGRMFVIAITNRAKYNVFSVLRDCKA